VSVDVFKSQLYKRLLLDRPTAEELAAGAAHPAGYVHIPVGTTDEWLKQLTSERRTTVTNKRTGRSKQEWVKARERNEALDCAVHAAAAAWNMGVERWNERRWESEAERRGIAGASPTRPEPASPPAAPIPAVQAAAVAAIRNNGQSRA
jgi:phage terminase large subunit GpA-like protein